jgi:glycosyl hydrolase family 114
MRSLSSLRLGLLGVMCCVACSSTTPEDSVGNGGGGSGAVAGKTGVVGGSSSAGSGGSRAGSGGSRAGSGGNAGVASGESGAPSLAGEAGEGGALGMAGSGGAAGQASGTFWTPTAGLKWQWQLSEDVTEPLAVDVYDIDWEADAATVTKLHAAGIKVICYVSVGSWEDFRPDVDAFPEGVIGNDYDGWPGEKYVDIRAAALRSVMLARFDVCQQKGFDAIEPDNMDVFELGADSGFPLTEQDGVDYALFLATAAHERGLGIGQKNAASISAAIESEYQWALTESCYSDGDWCADVSRYAQHDKPVFMCEYEAGSFDAACSKWQKQKYSPILKSLDLDEPVSFCP